MHAFGSVPDDIEYDTPGRIFMAIGAESERGKTPKPTIESDVLIISLTFSVPWRSLQNCIHAISTPATAAVPADPAASNDPAETRPDRLRITHVELVLQNHVRRVLYILKRHVDAPDLLLAIHQRQPETLPFAHEVVRQRDSEPLVE
ncbi:hypothetical protein KC325_g32 [Hortaea werneckii]|nr:hypothetical protein KC325_g32 [Hortaea werneckii]